MRVRVGECLGGSAYGDGCQVVRFENRVYDISRIRDKV